MSKFNPLLKFAIAALGNALSRQSKEKPPSDQSKPTKPPSHHNSRYGYDEAWELMWPVCQGNEMMIEESKRMMDDIISNFGIDAAVYIALTGWERHDEASVLKAKIGKERVSGASKLFEDATYGVYR